MKKSGWHFLTVQVIIFTFPFVYAHSKEGSNRKSFKKHILIAETGYNTPFGFDTYGEKVFEVSALKEYTGTFDFVDFPSMEIYLYNGDLYGETSHGKSVLKKTTQKDTFEIVDYQSKLTFNRDVKGKIISIELDAPGFKSTGVKRKISN